MPIQTTITAIRARRGDLGIVPGSMGTGSYIVRGLGNPDSFDSAPHGAGRRMSRTQAKKKFTIADLARETEGVECRKDRGVLDEIPSAYKEIGDVIRKSSDLVEVVTSMKQVLCVKGSRGGRTFRCSAGQPDIGMSGHLPRPSG